jgi:hypothetical protein
LALHCGGWQSCDAFSLGNVGITCAETVLAHS